MDGCTVFKSLERLRYYLGSAKIGVLYLFSITVGEKKNGGRLEQHMLWSSTVEADSKKTVIKY